MVAVPMSDLYAAVPYVFFFFFNNFFNKKNPIRSGCERLCQLISGCSSEFWPIPAEMEDSARMEFWVFFSLNLKQNMFSEYKEKMSTLLANYVNVFRRKRVYHIC